MTIEYRFLFDECLPKAALFRGLRPVFDTLEVEIHIEHLLSKFPRGTPDSKWIPALAKEGGWVIVSADRGKKSKRAESFPRICQEFGVTYVMLSARLLHSPSFDKLRALIDVTEDLVRACEAPPGTGYLLQFTPKKRVILRCVHDSTPDDRPARQGNLFEDDS